MNYLSSKRLLLPVLAMLCACGAPASESSQRPRHYQLDYTVTLDPAQQSASVEVRVDQSEYLLREMRFDADPERFSEIEGDGELSVTEQRVVWRPDETGGALRWTVRIPQLRNDTHYDAWLGDDWGLFRLEDVIPRAATRTLIDARSRTGLSFQLPMRWSVVTEYASSDGNITVDKTARRFSQPSGWLVVGKIGVRRDTINGIRLAIAAPQDQGVRRLDMLALFNWVLPELQRILPDSLERLTVVSAASPMWRGGLSGPQSIYIHADRPLISENGTSTLLHELMHVALGASAAGPFDWIVEGLAEYYSLQLLGRSGTLSPRRVERAFAWQADWASSADDLCAASSTGARTALAVGVFQDLDRELRERSDGEVSLDDMLVAIVAADTPLDLATLQGAAEKLLDGVSETLRIDNLPGCRSMSAGMSEPL
jgi:hypothetical protein